MGGKSYGENKKNHHIKIKRAYFNMMIKGLGIVIILNNRGEASPKRRSHHECLKGITTYE
jgi:hypothetical protein